MWRMMERLVVGDASFADIDKLLEVTKQVESHTICALGDAAAWPIQGLVRHFRDQIQDRITKACQVKNWDGIKKNGIEK